MDELLWEVRQEGGQVAHDTWAVQYEVMWSPTWSGEELLEVLGKEGGLREGVQPTLVCSCRRLLMLMGQGMPALFGTGLRGWGFGWRGGRGGGW